MKKRRKLKRESFWCWIIMAVLSAVCLLPLLLVVSASLTDEQYIQQVGYSIWPVNPSLSTYRFLIANKGKMLVRSLLLTILVVVVGTMYSVSIVTCYAYAISQKKTEFRFARVLSFFAWFATIFSGGVLPWYILCTQYYGLKNNIWALFIPYGMNVWNMFILRGNFRQVPPEILESAKIDGASNRQVFTRIAIPLAKSGIVTVALFNILTFWNDFYLSKWLITDSDYYTLQMILYNMLSNTQALLRDSSLSATLQNVVLPTETAKMAVAVMAILPIAVLYPFTLKYFVQGINVGGVKG